MNWPCLGWGFNAWLNPYDMRELCITTYFMPIVYVNQGLGDLKLNSATNGNCFSPVIHPTFFFFLCFSQQSSVVSSFALSSSFFSNTRWVWDVWGLVRGHNPFSQSTRRVGRLTHDHPPNRALWCYEDVLGSYSHFYVPHIEPYVL